ncbi:MAG: Nif11-like leader peptide family RiPP precursor [Defluviitaleaceae bacterium]|nr:Nif11-like leader peptide family RiPP precursor [Defluviitaleaceae bacterium]
MNSESVEQFFKFLLDNKECQATVRDFGGDVNAITAYAREQGYDFSADELSEYQNKAQRILDGRMRKKLEQPEASLTPGIREFHALIKLAETDEETAKRLDALNMAAPEQLIAYGKEKGFVFNEQDIQAFGKDILEPSDELSDEELELAAGGTTVLVAFGVSAAIVLGIAAMGGAFIAFGVVGKF